LSDNSVRIVDAAPPKDLQHLISEGKRPCGTGRFAWAWKVGPVRGMPVSLYCAEPVRCVQTGICTGPRFVPHLAQYKHIADDGTPGPPRRMSAEEMLTASRFAAAMAQEETGVRDTRTDAEVREHIDRVRARMKKAVFGQ
jgi:hypothetical protein